MRSLWRRFMAWLNADDQIQVYVAPPPEVCDAAREVYERYGHTNVMVWYDTDQDGKVSVHRVFSLAGERRRG